MKWYTFNLLKKQPTPERKKDRSENIESWEVEGGNNDFPQQLLQNVYNSPIGSAALDVWHEFTNGDGFVDKEVGLMPVNRKQTLEDLNSKLSADLSSMFGLAIIVTYNMKGEKTGFHHLPFEGTRLGELNDFGVTDKIYYNPYYGTKDYDKKYTKWFYSYNPDQQAVIEQITLHNQLRSEGKVDFPYPGQVFWFSIERPLARVYPQPFYYSAIDWFQVDAEVQLFHNRNIKNNFLLSGVMNVFGDPDQPAGKKDDKGNPMSTVGEEFEKDMQSFQGAQNAGGMLVQWIRRAEEQTTISPFPNNTNHDLFVTLQNLVTDQIAIGTKVPRVLLGIGEGGKLGDTQEIINAIRVMQGRTKRLRNTLESIYSKIMMNFNGVTSETDFTIKNINPVNVLPDWVINTLTDNEKRKYLQENFNIELELGTNDQLTVTENDS